MRPKHFAYPSDWPSVDAFKQSQKLKLAAGPHPCKRVFEIGIPFESSNRNTIPGGDVWLQILGCTLDDFEFFPNPFWNKSFGKLQAENARGVEKQHGQPAEPQSDHLLRTPTPTLFPTRSAAAKHAAMQPQVAMLAEATAPRPAPWPARTSRRARRKNEARANCWSAAAARGRGQAEPCARSTTACAPSSSQTC